MPPPLTLEEEASLIANLSNGSSEARDRLIERNLRLVAYTARKFENTGIDLDDLVSIGTIGLIKAINSFDPGKKVKLATYASRCIENEILMYLRRTKKEIFNQYLEDPINIDYDGNELLLIDVLDDSNSRNIRADCNSSVEHAIIENFELEILLPLWLNNLNNNNKYYKNIIELRYFDRLTQKQVAEKLGISQSYIARLEKRAIQVLQKYAKKCS